MAGTYNYRRRVRRQMVAQTDQLKAQVAVNGIAALFALGFANSTLRSPYPDCIAWQVANDVAKKKADDFWASLLSLGIHVLRSEL